MSTLFHGASIFHFRQAVLQLNAIHANLSPSTLPLKLRLQLLTPCSTFTLRLTRPRFPGLFGSIHLEQVPQFHAGLVQLRLAVSYRASRDFRDFIMLVTFYIVKNKNHS